MIKGKAPRIIAIKMNCHICEAIRTCKYAKSLCILWMGNKCNNNQGKMQWQWQYLSFWIHCVDKNNVTATKVNSIARASIGAVTTQVVNVWGVYNCRTWKGTSERYQLILYEYVIAEGCNGITSVEIHLKTSKIANHWLLIHSCSKHNDSNITSGLSCRCSHGRCWHAPRNPIYIAQNPSFPPDSVLCCVRSDP